MKQVFKNGDVVDIGNTLPVGVVTIPADTSVADVQATQLDAAVLSLEFASSADGRGFSLAKILARKRDDAAQLIATGAVIPDQLELAWQCGFDSAIISDEHYQRYGEASWRDNQPAVAFSYGVK